MNVLYTQYTRLPLVEPSYCSVSHSISFFLYREQWGRWCLGHSHEQVKDPTHGEWEEHKPTGRANLYTRAVFRLGVSEIEPVPADCKLFASRQADEADKLAGKETNTEAAQHWDHRYAAMACWHLN